MSLIHGKAITSKEIENIVSREFTPIMFASLCNAIVWSSAGVRCSSLPSFTERVNAKDRGIDAEWQIELSKETEVSSPLLGAGWNVFQYKQRDVFAQGGAKTFSNLKSGLKGALKDIYEKTSHRPDRYVLFLNIDLTHDTEGQKGEIKEKIFQDYDKPDDVHVEIVAAGELSTFLNDIPHIRSSFFATSSFESWEEANSAHKREQSSIQEIEVIGRKKELDDLRSFLEEPEVRAVVLTGQHYIGKTRLALEGTKNRPIETVHALDPRSMNVSDLLALESHGIEIIVIIADPDLEKAQEYVDMALSRSNLKLLITLPTAENHPLPKLFGDTRMQSIHLHPLSEDDSWEILKIAGPKLDFNVRSWVVEQAGGIPGLLLIAAAEGIKLRTTAVSFMSNVAEQFEIKIKGKLNDNSFQILSLLSLMTHVGFLDKHSKEIGAICKSFGGIINSNTVLNTLQNLKNSGCLRIGGSFVEVVPPILANRLAETLLKSQFTQLSQLYSELSQSGQLRLIRRLRNLNGADIDLFWDYLFSESGPLKNLIVALKNGRLLRDVTVAIPMKICQLIKDGLDSMTVEERLRLEGKPRRELMWSLVELRSRKQSSELALRCLVLLAEAETETYGNNATGVFSHSFHPQHPQIPISLYERLTLLKEVLSSNNSVDQRLIGIKSIKSATERRGSFSLLNNHGPEPLDRRPEMTYADIWDYNEALINILLELSQSNILAVAKSASEILPNAIANCSTNGRPKVTVAQFESVVELNASEKVTIDVSDLREALNQVVKVFNDLNSKPDNGGIEDLEESIGKLKNFILLFDEGDFTTRLKRWAGKWTTEDRAYEVDQSGNKLIRWDKELKALAKEAINDPSVLPTNLFEWLCSGEAQKAHSFFSWLGQLDSKRMLLSEIEKIGCKENGSTGFAAYFYGIGVSDQSFVSMKLDEYTEKGEIIGESIIKAMQGLVEDTTGVVRVEYLIQMKQVEPSFVVMHLQLGKWVESLSNDQYLRLLKAVAGRDVVDANLAIEFINMWIYMKRQIVGELSEFAWHCVIKAKHLTPNEANDCDQLAAHMALSDNERGFIILEELLKSPYEEEHWEIMEPYRGNEFWDILHKANPERAIGLVLSAASEDKLLRHQITYNFREVADQENDAEILTTFAMGGEEQAEVVCESISAGRQGFWPIAMKLLEAFPNNVKIRKTLGYTVHSPGRGLSRSPYTHLESRLKEVQELLDAESTPIAAVPWLEELESSLSSESNREQTSDADERVDM